MTLAEAQLGALHEAVKKHTTDEILVMAIPGTIRNNGKNVDAVQVTIGNNITQKLHQRIYRGMSSEFERWLDKEIDKIKNNK